MATSATLANLGTERVDGQVSMLVKAENRNIRSIFCHCLGQNQYLRLSPDTLVALMTSLRKLEKSCIKQSVLGDLPPSILPATGAIVDMHYRYSLLRVTACKTVFLIANRIKKQTAQTLKSHPAQPTARVPSHGNVGHANYNFTSPFVLQSTMHSLSIHHKLWGK